MKIHIFFHEDSLFRRRQRKSLLFLADDAKKENPHSGFARVNIKRAPRGGSFYIQLLTWRKREDSNLRTSCPVTRFPSVLLKPLGHTSFLLIIPKNSPFGESFEQLFSFFQSLHQIRRKNQEPERTNSCHEKHRLFESINRPTKHHRHHRRQQNKEVQLSVNLDGFL